jgi:prolipoprotein diacylglyceryltransferase
VPAGPVHDFGHFALAAVMGLVLGARIVHILRRRREPNPNAWTDAHGLHGWDAWLARGLTVLVPIAWLVGAVTVLVHHESNLYTAAPAMAALLPIAAALWIGASFAWHDFCRDRVGAALDESDRRYREYWKDVARPS